MKRLLITLALCGAAVSFCRAEDGSLRYTDETEHAEPVVDHMVRKLSRGVANVVTGPGEFIRQIDRSQQEDGVLLGTAEGVVKGAIMTVARMATGVVDVATFIVPIRPSETGQGAKTVDYEPLLHPTYVWQSCSCPVHKLHN